MSDLNRFEEIREEIMELVEEAIGLVPDHAEPRARAYWYAHIITSITNDHCYMGGSMCSMRDTSDEWEDYDEEEDDDEEEVA